MRHTTRQQNGSRSARARRQARAKARRGFTLTEIMVTISIIAILMAVGAAGVLSVQGVAAKNQTLATMAALKAIADEYKRQAGDPVNDLTPPPNEPIDWNISKPRNATGAAGSAVVNDSIERFVWAVDQDPLTRKMVYALGAGVFVDDKAGIDNKFGDRDGFNEVVDGWGRRLDYFQSNSSGPIRPHARPFFVSAGQDGEWGDYRSSASTAAQKQAKDNLYSPGVKVE